jgi:type II secretory ATPase GspE/PulE/Tfp pilus assembly ATPase PilB-like protein
MTESTMLTPDLVRDTAPATSLGAARLGDTLLVQGLLTPAQLRYALQKQQVEGGRLGNLLVQHGLATERDVVRVLAAQLGERLMDTSLLATPAPAVLALFNREQCLRRGFMPLARNGDELEVLLGDGTAAEIAEVVMQRCGLRCRFARAESSHVARFTRQSYYFAHNPLEALIDRELVRLSDDPDNVRSPERLLDLLLHLAVRERATDIHLVPSPASLHVLLRVDGVLRPMLAMPSVLLRLLVFAKLTAEMDISEQRRPQDGSFHATILEAPFTVRVSTLISEHGERMVLRLLPERSELSGLKELGFLDTDVARLERIFAKPAGLVLITGPTGSGKSTTLHAALRMQSLIERNVLTVEDPVEYRVPGACQTEVNRRAGYEFSSALRHFLRHDPDVMLIGEIRDGETAQAAIEAAATGHLVLSTLHVASVFGVVPRLRPLGLDAQMIADNLLAIVNQRLVRQCCPFCSEPVAFSPVECAWLDLPFGASGRAGRGCERCGGTGYYGRMPVYEVLEINHALANGIADDAGREHVSALAAEHGFSSMGALARWRVREGHTTIAEVRRVVGEGPPE